MTRIFFAILLLPYICLAQNVEKVASINPQLNSFPANFMEYNGKLYFAATDEAHGAELWVTDGTAGGTHIVKDILPGSVGSGPMPFIIYDNKLYLTADDGNDRKIWVTDGTEQGTYLLKNINGMIAGKPVIFNNRLFFLYTEHIWVTDGTETGTKKYEDELGMSFDHVTEMVVFNNRLFFNAQDAGGDNELWHSDGTAAGTGVFMNINPTEGSRISNMITAGNQLYFWAHDVPFSSSYPEYKPYVSDGSQAGTKIIFTPNPAARNYLQFYAFGDTAALSYGLDWSAKAALYITDGTAPGTVKIFDQFNQGLGEHFAFNGKMFFMASGPHGEKELYVSDGTAQGTQLFDDFNFPQRGEPHSFTVSDDKFYFISENINTNGFPVYGYNIWISDGTVKGTYMPEFPGRNMKNPLIVINDMGLYKGEIYLGGKYDDDGMQLWKLDNRFPTSACNTLPGVAGVTIHPNPAHNELYVGLQNAGVAEVIDMTGRLLLKQQIDKTGSVNITTLQAGTYLLRYGGGDYIRFVKQ